MNAKDYPADWRAIRQRIVFDRAGGRCETPGCRARHGSIIARLADGEPAMGPDGLPLEDGDDGALVIHIAFNDLACRFVKVILTTAHLCNCYPKCGIDAHLAALCQRCHFKYDAKANRAKAAEKRHKRLGYLALEFPPETD